MPQFSSVNHVLCLLSFSHPPDQGSGGDSCRKSRYHREHKVALQALACIIQKLFSGVTTLFRGTPSNFHAILDRIRNRTGGARCLPNGFANLLSRFLHYCL
jgi:hypothetical protein